MSGRVDALIVNYEAGPWLRRAVAALEKPLEIDRIIVVDNASTDDSLAGLPETVRIVRNPENRGYATAMAQAAEQATAPFLLLLNPDLELEEGALAHLLTVADAQPRAGIVGAFVAGLDGQEQRACRRRTPTPGRSAVTMLGLERLGLSGVNIRDALPSGPVRMEAVSGAVLLVRRSCWDELGGLDTGYFLHCEDLDLFRRALEAGWEVWFQPLAHARHVGGYSHRGGRARAERHKRDGMLRYFDRYDAPRLGALAPLWRALIRLRFALKRPFLARADRRDA